MRGLKLLPVLVVVLLVSAASSRALAAPILQTIPLSGAISGVEGETVGWGYAIINDDPVNWLVATGVSADPFVSGIPDGSVFDFPSVAPGTTVALPFNLTAFLGLYAFSFDPGTPAGTSNLGTFVVSAEWWDGDPTAGGSFISAAPDLSAYYSVTLASVPEPGALGLLALVGAARVVQSRRSRFKRRCC